MKSKHELQPGDAVDVRMMQWDGSFVDGRINAREEWIPGVLRRIDDFTVTVLIYGKSPRDYPTESPDWRPAR